VLKLDETKHGVDKLRDVGFDVEWIELDKDHDLTDEEMPMIRKWVRDHLKGKSSVPN
jgi:phospholipase/carboxylesterase